MCAKCGTEMDHKYDCSFIICRMLLSHYEQGMMWICETVPDRTYVSGSTLKYNRRVMILIDMQLELRLWVVLQNSLFLFLEDRRRVSKATMKDDYWHRYVCPPSRAIATSKWQIIVKFFTNDFDPHVCRLVKGEEGEWWATAGSWFQRAAR